MTKILITGAKGFIGKQLVQFLKVDNFSYEIFTFEKNVIEASNWKEYPNCDVVVHLASQTFVPKSWEEPTSFFQTNISGTINALEYCRINKAKLIYISAYLYGVPDSLPINENALVKPNNPYAFSKKIAEETCRFYFDFYGVEVTIIRPFNVYGSGQSESFLIPFIFGQLRSGDKIHIKDITPKRDYIYITDVVSVIYKVILNPQKFEIFNIGSGKSYSPLEVIRVIESIMYRRFTVISDETPRNHEIMDTIADISKAKKVLDWEPAFSLVDGLKDYISKEF